MSQLDELLARSQSPGRFVQRRQFTLSREKAIEKQREFALRDQSQWILELIQAAVFAGATYIAVDVQPLHALIAWVGGRPLTEDELANLLDYLFADRGDPETRHLVQLAVGTNALLQRQPRVLRIETGVGDGAIRLDLDAKGHGQIGVVGDPIGGTYILANYGWDWLKRFTARTFTTEQGLVEERCIYTPTPILLNGTAPFGYRSSRHIGLFGAEDQESFDEGGRRGVLGIHTHPLAQAGVRIVIGGVWITTIEEPLLAGEPLVGVICDDNLRKTADHGDIVRDERYLQMLHAIQPHATALLRRASDTSYHPPNLPPIPATPEPGSAEDAAAEALDEELPSLPPRPPRALDSLETTDPSIPLFWCLPSDENALRDVADPLHFPYPVLVLTPNQALALEARLRRPIRHLLARGSITSHQRTAELQFGIQTHSVQVPGAKVEISLQSRGPLTSWSDGEGIPFAIAHKDRLRYAGRILNDVVSRFSPFDANDPPKRWTLSRPLHLPRISLRIYPHDPEALLPDDATIQGVIGAVERIVWDQEGDLSHLLFLALLPQITVPRLQHHPEHPRSLRVHASLPSDWPADILHRPLQSSAPSGLTLSDFLQLLGTQEVARIPDSEPAEVLTALEGLEERFGYGHLVHPSLEDIALFGVGRIDAQWIFLDGVSLWRHPALTQMIWVAATFSPRLEDQNWTTEAHPFPEIVAARAQGVQGEDWEAGYALLFRHLFQLESDDGWRASELPVSVERMRGMGRLALLHLATWLDHRDLPLLLPSDGGARRSLNEVLQEPAARVILRGGVHAPEPWTFPLTADEHQAIDPQGRIRPRFDDDPEVWRTLARDSEAGWLLREEVHQDGMTGWLGLRHPYDGTAGILIQATGRLMAIPEMDRRIPCHGLLHSTHGDPQAAGQRQLLQMAGLRLYQSLNGLLQSDTLDPERLESARLYGFAFAKIAHRRGQLSGTALELARRIEVRDDEGAPWGTVETWLLTPAEERPPPPKELVLLEDPITLRPEEVAPQPIESTPLHARLEALVATAGLRLRMAEGSFEGTIPVFVRELSSDRNQVSVVVDTAHPLARRGIHEEGPAREALLLEAARRIAVWGSNRGVPLRLPAMQQLLLVQRLGLGG